MSERDVTKSEEQVENDEGNETTSSPLGWVFYTITAAIVLIIAVIFIVFMTTITPMVTESDLRLFSNNLRDPPSSSTKK